MRHAPLGTRSRYDGTRKRQASTAPNRRRRTRGRRRRAAQAAGGGPDAALELSVLMPNSKITSFRPSGCHAGYISGYIKIHARYIKDTCNMMRYMYLKCIHREAERTASRRRRRRRATQGNHKKQRGGKGAMLKNNTTFVKEQHSTLGHLPRHLRHQRQLTNDAPPHHN